MLAAFENSVGKPPEELRLPSSGSQNTLTGKDIAELFQSLQPEATVYKLSNGNFMALSHENENPCNPRSTVVMDDVFCIFTGALENICELRRHYGLSRQATEAMVVVEAYKVLRDRAPYPVDQVIKDLQGKFAFILFDAQYTTFFAARDRDGSIQLYLGMAGDGSLVCCNDPNIMSRACEKSYAALPSGCMFMNKSGLMSFDHPLHKVKALVHKDEGGEISGVYFQVDLFKRLRSIPRSGSAANWADAAVVEGE